jgi:SecD/SecF fusion protein
MNDQAWQGLLTVALVAAAIGGLYYLCSRLMRPFHNRAFICLSALLLGGWIVYGAAVRYARGEGGFKLGVDLSGGTILVYEVDADKMRDAEGEGSLADLDAGRMVEQLKRRIDPNDLYNVTIRPVGGASRYEIILPTGGAHQALLKLEAWDELKAAVTGNPAWKDALADADLDVDAGRTGELAFRIRQALDARAWSQALAKFRERFADKLRDKPEIKLDAVARGNVTGVAEAVKPAGIAADEVTKFFNEEYKPASEDSVRQFVETNYRFGAGGQRQDFSAEQVEQTKSLVARQGSLEFRIVANKVDDSAGIAAARAFIENPANRAELESRARRGLPPPGVPRDDGVPGSHSYSWVEIGPTERQALGLSNSMQSTPLWQAMAKARADGKVYVYEKEVNDTENGKSGRSSVVLFSRASQSERLPADERAKKQIEYFMLLRDPTPGQEVTGEHVRSAEVDDFQQSVSFAFDATGGARFGRLTGDNVPTPAGEKINLEFRFLAIVLDGQVVSAPFLSTQITDRGQITMKNSPREDRVRLVKILRAGALPATLKPLPVSEQTIGPTLGQDTIRKGTWSLVIAFAAVLVFMIVYYEFAGIVACVALLANLLLTVAFMVFVQATFTLPGLAGLVLMLGMAVDANILIYERLREERDRGAGLVLALRNGYDRALPTILDTHLTSFFTAIVLYAVGNDQLRGFGISLASGLVISLFTSLYMTRLLFDVWQYKGWLKKLDMRRLLTKTNIDFMRIRYYWFTATLILTVLGLGLFLLRGDQVLDIDFRGGTAYGGQLREGQGKTMGEMREYLKNQATRLAVDRVEQTDDEGKVFRITYKNAAGTPVKVEFVEPAPGADRAAREAEVARRASALPDWSVVQRFVPEPPGGEARPGTARFFNVRTTEKEADLVQVSVDRLLAEDANGRLDSLLKSIRLESFAVNGKLVTLQFSDFASPGYLRQFLEREFRAGGLGDQAFDLRGDGKSKEGRYKTMTLEITSGSFNPERDRGKLDRILEQTKTDFESRPQPESLEKFDKVLAAETGTRAATAILASWAVILLFLWFRFGNWTFGLAAVCCLLHDLAFCLGAIAACHYLVSWAPGLASFLLIEDFKIDLPSIAALLTLVGYSVNDTIVVFDRIREVRGKNPALTPQMINDGINQSLSRTILASTSVFLVVLVLYLFGGESIRLFSFVMVIGVIVGTYSSIYIASPLLLLFGEGQSAPQRSGRPSAEPAKAS